MRRVICLLMLAAAACPSVRAAEPEEAKADPEFLIGEMRVQTLRGFDFLYASKETRDPQIANTIHELDAVVDRAVKEAKAELSGPSLVIYRAGGQPGAVTAELGWMVAPGTQPAAGAKVRRVEPFPCASILFCGAFKHLGKAYPALDAAVKKAGLEPTGEYREFLLHDEGDESPNNIVLVQAGLAEAQDPAKADPAVLKGALRVQTLAGFDCFSVGAPALFTEVAQVVPTLWTKIGPAAKEGNVTLSGPPIFRFLAADNPQIPFMVRLGHRVPAGTHPAGGAQVETLLPFRCATSLYCGNTTGLSEAVIGLLQALAAKGLKPNSEHRQNFLYFEEPDSPNNVILMQWGLQG